jgi:anthraniloyl-CoA monooxygenase
MPVALLGDAVHTAHFSVGSGTKMAMEDAVALAAALTEHQHDLPGALAAYETAAQPSVRAIQDSARPSLAWWEHFGRYHDFFEPWQFGYHFLSRSISDARLARRAPEFVAAAHDAWQARHGAEPLDTPFEHAGLRVDSRAVSVECRDDVPHTAAGLALSDARPTAPGPWAARLSAPPDEADLPTALAALAALADADPAFVAVHGGSALTRLLVCEQARMQHKVPALLVEPDTDHDRAVTAVLSGRADLVALDITGAG